MQPDDFGFLSVPVADGFIQLAITEIEFLEGKNEMTDVHLVDGTIHPARKGLAFFRPILAPDIFLEVHTSFLVNPLHISSYRREDIGYVYMRSGAIIPVSRSHRPMVLDYFRHALNPINKCEKNNAVALLKFGETPNIWQFPLTIGSYLVGRKSDYKDVNIMIATDDTTMSRRHFYILVEKTTEGELVFSCCPLAEKTIILNSKKLKGQVQAALPNNAVITAGRKTHLRFEVLQPDSDNNRTITGISTVTDKPK